MNKEEAREVEVVRWEGREGGGGEREILREK